MTTVMILRGLPGSGKDTYLDSLEKADGLTIARCSSDDYFMIDGKYDFDPMQLAQAHDSCFKSFVQICDTPMPRLDRIAVCNSNTQCFEIAPYLMYARCKGLDVEIVEVRYSEEFVSKRATTEPEMCAKRNVHGVPIEGIRAMYKAWEGSLPFWPKPTVVESGVGEFIIKLEGGDRTIPVVC